MHKFNGKRPRPCPKCGFTVTKEQYYRDGRHESCTIDRAYDSYTASRSWLTSRITMGEAYWNTMKELDDKAQAVPEHIERKCLRCNHGWAEGVVNEDC
jgi:hypothetical protein